MSTTNVQYSVGIHILSCLAHHYGEEIQSSMLAGSVNADPSFVRKVVSKLAKAGLVITTRGKNGSCALARNPKQITLLDIYRATEAPHAFVIHPYPVQKSCVISVNFKQRLDETLRETQTTVEKGLAKTTLADFVADIDKW